MSLGALFWVGLAPNRSMTMDPFSPKSRKTDFTLKAQSLRLRRVTLLKGLRTVPLIKETIFPQDLARQ
jgi:hypothetical protein